MTSLTDPGALEIIADAAKAPKKRVAKIVAMFRANAHGRTRIVNKNMEQIYTGLRPYISLSGASIRDPNAKPIK